MSEHFDGFEGIHIANIASYILDDAGCCELPVDSFNDRLDMADEEFKETLLGLISDDQTCGVILNAFFQNSCTVRNVFFEAGILCGIKLSKALATDAEQYTELMRRCRQRD